MLNEVHWKMLEVGEVKTIQPDHRTGAIFAVVMPVPSWRQDHITSLHPDPPTLHRRETPLAFDDEPHCKCYMSVGLCSLVGHHELQPCVQGVRCKGRICHSVRNGSEVTNASSREESKYSPRDGFTSISTLRSAWCSGTSLPASSKLGRMSAYLHRNGVHLGFGTGGFSLAICNQSGLVWACSARSSMTSVASWVLISTCVVVAIANHEGVSVLNLRRKGGHETPSQSIGSHTTKMKAWEETAAS